jgi:hypothetical protein
MPLRKSRIEIIWPALILLAASTSLPAQQPAPTLDAVLARVRANIDQYRTSVPNFSCDESIDSQRLHDGMVKADMKIESSFRMTRAGAGDLHETRAAHEAIVDGKPKKTGKLLPPYTFTGGFANVLQFLQSECNQYRLGDSAPFEPGKIVVLFDRTPVPRGRCRAGSFQGKAVIDPISFQVVHLDRRREDAEVNINWVRRLLSESMPSIHNVMTFAVDYGPVTLGEKPSGCPRV